jgi:hypothetical protein
LSVAKVDCLAVFADELERTPIWPKSPEARPAGGS